MLLDAWGWLLGVGAEVRGVGAIVLSGGVVLSNELGWVVSFVDE